MKLKSIRCLTAIGMALLTAGSLAVPTQMQAGDITNTPSAQAAAPKKHGAPYHGKVSAVDPAAMTFTVGTLTLGIASTTKITKDAKPAIFADIAVGENVSGAYKPDAAGKLLATSVKIGAPKKAKAAVPAPAPAGQ